MAAGEGQQVISSFFKPSQAPKRPPAGEVLILSSDDDEPDLPAPSRPSVKRVKLENEAEARPAAAAVKSAPLFRPVSPPVARDASVVVALKPVPTKRRPPSDKVVKWQYDPSASSSQAAPSASTSNSALARKLLGRNLLGQRKATSYLQQDHYLAANAEASGSVSPGTPMDSDDDFGGGEEDEDEKPVGKGKGKATLKGKGPSKEQDLSSSKFAQYAAKGSAASRGGSSAGAGKVKYTPL